MFVVPAIAAVRVGETQLPSLVAGVSRFGQCARDYRLQVDEGSGTQQAGAEPRESVHRHGKMWVQLTAHRPSRSAPGWRTGLRGSGLGAGRRHRVDRHSHSAQGLRDLRFKLLRGIIPGGQVASLRRWSRCSAAIT